MTQNQLDSLNNILNLGKMLSLPSKIDGGLLHTMWRLDTRGGAYAIKQLNATIGTSNEIIKNYEVTEDIARKFHELGIPAIVALQKNGRSIFLIDGALFIVYPWVHAQILGKNHITIFHAHIIASLIAQMHTADLSIDDLSKAEFPFHANSEIVDLIESSIKADMPFARQLADMKDLLLTINNRYEYSIPLLHKNLVISHGDLDQKNVLWDQGENAYLIDWESARLLNPTQEIINAALDWSGASAGDVNREVFDAMLHSYVQAGGIIDRDILCAAFYGIQGNWINWLVYNIRRAIKLNGSADERNRGITCMHEVLRTIAYLETKKEFLGI